MSTTPAVQSTDRSLACSIVIEARAAIVFAAWADVARWHTWDPDTQWARLDGPFVTGATGKIKSKQPLAAKMVLTAVQPDRGFTATIRALATRMDFDHTIESIDADRVRVTHTVRFSGLLAGLFRKQIGEPLLVGLPVTLERLKARCEQTQIAALSPSK